MPPTAATKVNNEPATSTVLEFPSAHSVPSFPALDAAHQRAMAVAAGDLHVAVRREVRRLLDAHNGNPMGAMRVGLERLRSSQLINSSEFTSLSEVCETVFEADRGKVEATVAYGQVRSLYDQLLIDETSSPIALTILSVFSAAYASALQNPSAAGAKVALATKGGDLPGQIGMGAGILIGGIVGGILGGVGGAVIGGVVGGIVGGAVGVCVSK